MRCIAGAHHPPHRSIFAPPMENLLLSTLMKVLLPSVAVVAVLMGARRRGIAWDEGLGLGKPTPKALLGWLAFWIAWLAVGEVVINACTLPLATGV